VSEDRSSTAGWVWVAVAAVVVVLGALAVVASRGDDDPVAAGGSREPRPQQTAPGTVTSGGGAAIPDDAGSSADALPEYDATADDPVVGRTIPSVTGHDAAGEPIVIEPDGKAKVLVFVAHWCPHCQREVPLLADHLDDTPMPDDVELIAVSTSVKPGAENYPPEEWLASEGWPAPVLADDEVNTAARAFGLSAFPYFVVVDADGKVVARRSGELTTDEFDDLVAAAQGR